MKIVHMKKYIVVRYSNNGKKGIILLRRYSFLIGKGYSGTYHTTSNGLGINIYEYSIYNVMYNDYILFNNIVYEKVYSK